MCAEGQDERSVPSHVEIEASDAARALMCAGGLETWWLRGVGVNLEDGETLLDHLCEHAAAATRAAGSMTVLPDCVGLLAFELLTLVAARHGLCAAELCGLLPEAPGAARAIVEDLMRASGARGRRAD